MDDLHDPETDIDREVLTYELFGTAARELAGQVADSGFRPDIVLAIARGGLTVAGALGYALAVKNCFAILTDFIVSKNGIVLLFDKFSLPFAFVLVCFHFLGVEFPYLWHCILLW